MKLPISSKVFRVFLFFTLCLSFLSFVYVGKVHAGATLNTLSDTLSSETPSTSSTHFISFKITQAVGSTLAVAVSSAYGSTPSSVNTDYVLKINGTTQTITSVSGVTSSGFTLNGTFGGTSGQVVTIQTIGITNQSSNGTFTETITTGNGETGTLAILILASAASNQLSLSAIDGPSITFSVSGGPLTLPSGGGNMSLNSAVLNFSSQGTVTISTNAANGAAISAQDANTGLLSATAGHTIASVAGGPVTLSAENFGMGAPTVGTGTVDAQYASAYSGNYQVGNLATSTHNFWSTNTAFASTVTISPFFNAYITGSTPAGTYSDTVTYIATATF